MPSQSVIPMFGNSKNKSNYPSSTSLYGKDTDVVEQWDAITPPPREIVSTVIRTPNAVHEVEKKIISTVKESGLVYISDSNGKGKLYLHGTKEQLEKSGSISGSRCDEINSNSEEMILNDKTPEEMNMTKHNSSIYHFLSTGSTTAVTLEATNATHTNMNTFKKIPNKLGGENFVPDLQIIDIVEIFNTLATLVVPILSSKVTGTTRYSSVSDNSTLRNVNDEVNSLDRTFSQIHQIEGKVELNSKKEHANHKHSGDNIKICGYAAVVRSEKNHKNFEKNSKLNPQVIPRSEFVKNNIDERRNRIINDCSLDQTDSFKEHLAQQKSSNYEAMGKTKLWESSDEAHEKYDEKDEKSPAPIQFERTLWQKLVAGVKCSQRDCREALKPTESVRRYLIEPSISRARKHSNRRL